MPAVPFRMVHYVAADGSDAFDTWFRTQNREVRARVQTRLDRVELGNFGDHRRVGKGVSELRIDVGAGYRVYYGHDGRDIVLLSGGTKKRQSRDVLRTQADWKAYRQEKRHARKST